MKVLDGALLEQRFCKNSILKSSNILEKTESYFINNKDIHSIYNIYSNTSYSLHIYSPPNFKAQIFN